MQLAEAVIIVTNWCLSKPMRAGKMLREIFLVMSAAGKILSVQSLKDIDSFRKEFFLLMDTGLVDGNPTTCNSCSHDEHLVRAVLCYGLYPGICSIMVSHLIYFCLLVF